MARNCELLASLFLCLVASCCARITHSSIRNDDRGWILLTRPFGCGALCHLEITLTHIEVHRNTKAGSDLNMDLFGLYLARTESDELSEDVDWNSGNSGPCPLSASEDSRIVKLTTFNQTAITNVYYGINDTYTYSEDSNKLTEGVNVLFFMNCDDQSTVSFDIKVEMYNLDKNSSPNYLSLGEMELPTMYLIMCLLFSGGLGLWFYTLYANKNNVHKIHWLMAVLGVFKVLTLLAQCGMYHYIRVTGSPDGWNVAYYIFTLFRGVLFFGIIVLIGTGWSYMTPFLGDNEKHVLMLVIPLQVFANIAIIVMDEFTPAKRTWFTWRDMMHFLDIICCCAILFPIVWRIKHLREASTTDGKAARSMQQLMLFRQFYVMVVIFIYFTRIVVYLMQTTLPYQYVWLSFAAGELATLVFYTLTGVQFRPHESSTYFKLINDRDVEMSSL